MDGPDTEVSQEKPIQKKESYSKMFFKFMVAAGFAESVALLLYYPFDLIKTRMQASNEKYGYYNIIDSF